MDVQEHSGHPKSLEIIAESIVVHQETQDIEHEHEDNSELPDTPVVNTKNSKRSAALWILKVQESYQLPQSTMEKIVSDMTGLFQDLLLDLNDDVKSCLSKAGIGDVPGLAEKFSLQSSYANPFEGLLSQY